MQRRVSLRRKSKLTEDSEAIAALKSMTILCEFCHHQQWSHEHHLCQGNGPRDWSDGDVRLVLLLCLECHNDIHDASAINRAIGLALVYLAGRGNNTELFWDVMGRKHFPSKVRVENWINRLTGARNNRWQS
jgi:hypothetical protein